MLRGLRGRFVLAMLAVSAITLGATAILLFSPLQQRLTDGELDGMVHAVKADRLAFAPLGEEQLRPRSPALQPIVRSLRRGSGAEVTVVGRTGDILSSTDEDITATSPSARRSLRDGQVHQGTVGPARDRELQVTVPLTVDGARIVIELRKPYSNVAGGVRVVRDAFLVAAGISLVVALVAGLLLSGRLVRRLRALRDTALRVSALGAVAELRPDSSRDEVGDLTRALATMQSQLHEQEQARRTFVATASHELRTPLTSLRLMLDTLRAELAVPVPDLDGTRAVAERAEVQADRLSGLASELLDLSRIDAGLPVRREAVPLGEIARSVVAELDVRLVESGRRIDLEDPGPRWAAADPGSVAQILRILLDNALHHAPDASRITVRVAEHAGQASIEVSDDGPGVPVGDAGRVFERFVRGTEPDEDTGGPPGFGLGLAIGRELAERMDGRLTLAPANGRGATFVLSLPTWVTETDRGAG